jgi:pyridoxine 5-phosphate synthase
MVKLCVNIDDIAFMRQSRGEKEPDPVQAAILSEMAGAQGICVHLREDRKHIQDRDAYLLKQTVTTHLNLKIAPVPEMVRLAIDISPYIVTLVSEKDEGSKSEGTLSVRAKEREYRKIISGFHDQNIQVSLFIDPDLQEIKTVYKIGGTHIALNTGHYANASGQLQEDELIKLQQSVLVANKYGINIQAGRGLNYLNITPIAKLDYVDELIIGHSIISRALLIGIDNSVRDMIALI